MLKRSVVALSALALIAFSLPVMAQDSGSSGDTSGFSIGPKVAGQLTSYTVDSDALSISPGIGFQAGAQGVYNFNKQFGLQGELYYSLRNYTLEADIPGATSETSISENHLTLPVMFRYNLPFGGDKIVPKVMVGPYASYWLGGTSEGEELSSDGVNAFTVGATAGIGVDIMNLGPGNLSIDARYQRGFLDRSDTSGDTSNFNQTYAMLSVGYLFNL
jgi:hypothetical protein